MVPRRCLFLAVTIQLTFAQVIPYPVPFQYFRSGNNINIVPNGLAKGNNLANGRGNARNPIKRTTPIANTQNYGSYKLPNNCGYTDSRVVGTNLPNANIGNTNAAIANTVDTNIGGTFTNILENNLANVANPNSVNDITTAAVVREIRNEKPNINLLYNMGTNVPVEIVAQTSNPYIGVTKTIASNRINPGAAPFNVGNYASPLAANSNNNPFGLKIIAHNLEVAGSVSVAGRMPIYGTVTLEGSVPSEGRAAVNFGCGSSAV